MGFLPNSELFSMGYVFEGRPFSDVNIGGIDLYSLGFIFEGMPFVVALESVPPATNLLKTINYALVEDLQDAMGVAITDLKSYDGALNV